MFSCKSVFILLSHEQGCKLYSRLFLICLVLTVLKLVVFWGLDSRGRWRCMLFTNTRGLPVHKRAALVWGKKMNFRFWTGCHLGCKSPLCIYCWVLFVPPLQWLSSWLLLLHAVVSSKADKAKAGRHRQLSPTQEQSHNRHRGNMNKISLCPPLYFF